MRYVFYRLKENQPDNVRRRFEGYEVLCAQGDWPPKPENYAFLYHCCEEFPNYFSAVEILESIFRGYNGGNIPGYFNRENFKEDYETWWPSGAAHGLSVGDIVVLSDTYPREDLQEGAYFCDSIGFRYLGTKLSAEFSI